MIAATSFQRPAPDAEFAATATLLRRAIFALCCLRLAAAAAAALPPAPLMRQLLMIC